MRFSFCFLAIVGVLPQAAVSEDCELIAAPEPLSRSLEGLASVMFEGFKPMIKRVEGSEPLIRILQYSVEPIISEVDGKLVVSSGTCTANEDTAVVIDDGGETSINGDGEGTATNGDSEDTATNGDGEDTAANGDGEDSAAASTTRVSYLKLAASAGLVTTMFMDGGSIATTGAITGLLSLALPTARAQEQASTCEQVVEVEIQTKSVGAVYMEDLLGWPDYDDEEDSYHWRPDAGDWPDRINASRTFRNSPSGAVYNYRNKVLMGMAQSAVLNQPPSLTAKEDVVFDIPTGIVRPDTDEELMALSVLEMQGLLRDGQITSVELTNVALNMLGKYDPEFNMIEVELRDLALRVAGEADDLFANGTYVSAIQGIPFAIKDTYDVAGYATAYGSFEFLDNIVETESPLVTYAVENYGVPLFKSTVPQMTWGTANFNGTVYSCLHGGYSAGAGNSGGSSIGSAAAVCLSVVPVAICEQTGSSCQAPAIANGISTIIPALGTFSRENNGLYSLESDRPGLLCRDILSCAVFYNYMRGTSPGDPQSRDVPFADPSKEDLSTYTIAFVDNSDTTAWPLAWDTPFKGQRNNVLDALTGLGAEVNTYDSLGELMEPNQLYTDMNDAGVSSTQGFDWYWLNVEGFFEQLFLYGADQSPAYGPVWVGQNFNFDGGSPHVTHIGATAYAYLDSMWMHGYASERGMYEMLQTLPDVVVHFGQSELAGAWNTNMIKRAGINTVHIPEFYWNTTSDEYVDWEGTRPIDFYEKTTTHAAMITCESKKYEPVKALAVCYQLQQALVPGGKLISPHIAEVQQAIASGEHDLDCPYDWSGKKPDYLGNYPDYLRARVESKLENIGTSRVCEQQRR